MSTDDSDTFLSFPSDDHSSDSSYHSTYLPTLNVSLDNQFSKLSKNFNVVHLNTQSIPAHFPEMLASFQSSNLHAILVSESWLKPCLPSTSYSLPGFHLIRNDRIGKGGGGVAIYLRNSIPFTVISCSPQPPSTDAAEHLLLEISLSHSKVLLGVFYCPSLHVDYFSSFESLLEDITPLYSHSIIMGDFNTCLLKNDTRSNKLLSLVESCNLHILPLSATHTLPNCIPTLLDLMIVSSPEFISTHGQYAADGFSHHDLIFLSYMLRPPKAKNKLLLQRNFAGMDLSGLSDDACNMDWSDVFIAGNIDLKVNTFNTLLIQLYDIHAPMKLVRMKHLPAPWLTDDLKSLILKKCQAKTEFKLNRSDTKYLKFKKIRNRCNTLCRDAQRRHIYKSVDNGDTARIWKFLQSLGVGKTPNKAIPNNIDIEGLNASFSTSDDILDNITKINTLNSITKIPAPGFPPFTFNQFSECDVKRNILSISSNAIGSDCISRKMIVPIIDIVTPVITHILNYSISSGDFPTLWKDADVIPLPKKSNPSSFSDYRPISILSLLSKVLEKLVYHQLNSFLNKNKLLNPFQSGFRAGHSTTSTLIKVTDDIRMGLDSKQLTVLVLLDFSNAFNNVDFDILLSLLVSLNISPSVIEWFQSYLHGRRQRIRIDECFSSWCNVKSGVPQGGVLSPLLFSIFINTITHKILSPYHMYADDLQIYSQSILPHLPSAVARLNQDLESILRWSRSFGIKVNASKCQAIVIGSPSLIARVDWSNFPPILFDGVTIHYSHKVKNLGVLIDNTLSWSCQVKELSRKTFAAVGSLRRLRHFLPIPTKVMLAQSLLLSILDYADASCPDLTEAQLNKLERLQNLGIRFIFGLRKYDHVSEFRTKLKWLPIRFRRNLHILSLLYCVLFYPTSPFYLKEKFQFLGSHSKVLRSSDNLTLRLPSHSSRFFKKSFNVQAILLWNALPLVIRQAQSLNKFKVLVKDHYLRLCTAQ